MPSSSSSSAASSVIEPPSLITFEPSALLSHLENGYLREIARTIFSEDPTVLTQFNEWTGHAESYLDLEDPTDESYKSVETLGDDLTKLFNSGKFGTMTDCEDHDGLGAMMDVLEFPKIFHAYVKGDTVHNGYHGGRGQVLKAAEEYLESIDQEAKKQYDHGPWLDDIDKKRLAQAMATVTDLPYLEVEPHKDLIRRIHVWQQKRLKIDKGDEVKRKRDDDGSGDEVPPKEKKFAFRSRQSDNPA
jgi:hypothetical protein